VLIAAKGYASELADYESYRAAATASGIDRVAPSPLAPLALLRGATEYLEIIGAVIAITLGYLTVSRERSNRTLQLLRSRPVSSGELATGSLIGAVGVIATLASVTAAVGVISVGLIGHDWVNATQSLRLLLAYTAAIVYLSAFYCVGTIATAKSRFAVNGLMIALGIWLIVVLVLPQIGDTLDADNQVPGGLFKALNLDHDGEVQVLTHFTAYERLRTWTEEASLAKHYERFSFAMTDVKERYRPFGLARLLRQTRNDIGWMVVYLAGLIIGLRRSYRSQPTITQGAP
jgi:ABC-2 type transport system permease protein